MILTLLATNTEDDDATSSFTSGITSTYDEYMFVLTAVSTATEEPSFTFQASTDGGSNYNVTLTSTFFDAQMRHDGAGPGVGFEGTMDQAQGTGFQVLNHTLLRIGHLATSSLAGILHLFTPSNTTYVKHFYARTHAIIDDADNAVTNDAFIGGYFNTTSAINAVQFKMSSGNMDGVIQMYGVA